MSLLRSKMALILAIGAGLVIFIALIQGAKCAECADPVLNGGESCSNGGDWDPMQKLDEIGTGKYDQVQSGGSVKWPEKSRTNRWGKAAYGFDNNQTAEESTSEPTEKENGAAEDKSVENKPSENKTVVAFVNEAPTVRSSEFKEMLVPIEDITESDILIDVSQEPTEFINGAVVLSYDKFLLNGGLKSVQEVAQILGDAGISANDSVVIYGECLPCGGGPAASSYIYWMMKSLGHEKIRVMDGTIVDWKALGLPTTNENNTGIRPAVSYIPNYTSEFIASYDYVKSGEAQIIDARTIDDFGAGSIPGAINIPFESVLKDNKIKDESSLRKVFAILNKNRPIVVYTETGIKASVVWFSLELLGYNAKLYSWSDWRANELQKDNSTDQQ